jgi:tetratricopeptide (TPR) repeat protein
LADVDQISQGLDQALTELQRRELIREKSRLPHRVYSFKHTLTQETAYRSLLLKNRRELHRLVGESLENREPERINHIARHFQEARELARAFPYFVEAGNRAAHAYSTAEAISNYETALESIDKIDDPAQVRRAFEGLGTALTFANEIPKALETYDAMLDYGNSTGDIPTQVSALNKLSYVNALRLGQFQKAEELIVESERLARDKEDKAGLSELGLIRCMMCTAVADFDGVVRYMDETVALGRELAVKEQMAMGLAHIASSQLWMLQFDEARETLQEGLQLSREIEDREHEAELLVVTASTIHWRNGDFEAARQAAADGLEIATRIGSSQSIPVGLRNLGYFAHQAGDYERALTYFERYRQASQKGGLVWYEAESLCLLGSVNLDISPAMEGRIVEYHEQANQMMAHPAGTMMGASAWTELGSCALAINDMEQAAEFFQIGLTYPTVPMNWERPRLLHGQAQLALADNDLDKATSLLAEAKGIVEQHAIRSLYPLIAFAEAQIHTAHDDLVQAAEAYSRAEKLAIEMGLRPFIWKARANLSQLLLALGQTAEAETMKQEAQAMVNEIAGLFEDEELKAMFLENALNYQVLEATN